MPSASVELSPSEYWNSTEATRAQRVYVSFCELAAGALDYAEGLSLLRRDERRQGAARLNWAGTAFYYSLVHSARFLAFTAVGDFPTQHSLLAKAFRSSEPTGVTTDWLKSFAHNVDGRYVTKLTLKELVNCWSAGAEDEKAQEIQASLEWFSDALTKAKALRNENNYEALLIAHEYRHEYLNNSFKRLAETMEAVSRRGVAACVALYARLLRSEVPVSSCVPSSEGGGCSFEDASDASTDPDRLLEGAFISRCVQSRIVEPARDWYGTDTFAVANSVSVLMKPLTDLSRGPELDVRRIKELVSTDLFSPKVGLMDKFMRKIDDLHRVLDDAEHSAGSPFVGERPNPGKRASLCEEFRPGF